MNIWFFNHYAVPPSLYPLARTYNFAKYLIRKDHSIKIFAASTVHNSEMNLIQDRNSYREETVDGIDHVYLKSSVYKSNGIDRIINMFQYTLKLFQVTKKFEKPEIIMASSVHPLACFAGIMLARKYKCKCVVEIADLWPLTLIEFGIIKNTGLASKLLYKLEHWIYKHADEIIFTMEGGLEYVKHQYDHLGDINYSKISYINNGVDLELFNRQMLDWAINDADIEDEGHFKVVYTGSLGEANSPMYMVEAAKIVQDRGYGKIKFIVYGAGALKHELEEYCMSNHLTNVIFKGKVEKKYIPSILSKSNLNIFTGKPIDLYRYGLSLNKMFDYMASGKPTISNINCGYDNLKKYKCGITVGAGEAIYLAEGIIRFYKMSKDEYIDYCNNAASAAKEFDFKNLTNQLEEIFLKLL